MVKTTGIIQLLVNLCLSSVMGNTVKTQLEIKGSPSLDRMFKKVIIILRNIVAFL